MAEPKTTRNESSVAEFLAAVGDDRRRTDAQALCHLMAEVTAEEPAMWGTSIVGFGQYRYRYGSARTGEWMAVGFAPRKQNLTIYLAEGHDRYPDLVRRLGPVTAGKGCLYVKRLDDIDLAVLRELIAAAFAAHNGQTRGA